MTFFDEAEGVPSSMRLMCFLSLIASFASMAATSMKLLDPQTGIAFAGMYLGAALGAKTFQKFAEKKKQEAS